MSTFKSSDVLTNLSQLLPTGTFLTFQALAPLFTNNGDCRSTEKIVTGILLGFFVTLCFCLSFVDSITTEEGTVYYGIVTTQGLYNPKFKTIRIKDRKHGADDNPDDSYFRGVNGCQQFDIQWADFVNGVLNVLAFGALSCFTPPITTCYYPRMSATLVKTVPILVGLLVGVLFGMFPSGRHGVGFATTTDGRVELESDQNGSSTSGPVHVHGNGSNNTPASTNINIMGVE